MVVTVYIGGGREKNTRYLHILGYLWRRNLCLLFSENGGVEIRKDISTISFEVLETREQQAINVLLIIAAVQRFPTPLLTRTFIIERVCIFCLRNLPLASIFG